MLEGPAVQSALGRGEQRDEGPQAVSAVSQGDSL